GRDLHSSEHKNVELNEIAVNQEIPKHFLSKILQLLVKQKLLLSMRGPNGGFRLCREPKEISLVEIVEAIDGLDIFKQCGIGIRECDDQDPCQIHDEYKASRERMFCLFQNKTLEALTEDVRNGDSLANITTPPPYGNWGVSEEDP
ncbi:MAG: RrF2 family transcriptional regulator, partial [Bacteroidota bacterium]